MIGYIFYKRFPLKCLRYENITKETLVKKIAATTTMTVIYYFITYLVSIVKISFFETTILGCLRMDCQTSSFCGE